jgi:hypothetical protein
MRYLWGLTSEGVYSDGLVVALLQLGENGPLERLRCCSSPAGAAAVLIGGALATGKRAAGGMGPL